MAKKNLASSKKKTQKKSAAKMLPRIPSAWFITKRTLKLVNTNRGLFLRITVVYGLLNLLLVRGFSGATDVDLLKDQFNEAFTGNLGSLVSGLGVFAFMLGGSGNTSNPTAGAYQFFLGIVVSLAVIWMIRKLMSGTENVKVKDAFYQGMYPLVPFVLVLLVVVVQLIPMLIGSSLYSLVVTNGIAIHVIEKIIWFGVFVGLSALSFYWISSSLIALYIVTLPDMTPLKALRSAKELVRTRRLSVIRKLLWLPLVMLVIAALIMLPIILVLTPLAQWIFFLLTMFGLVVAHTYMYVLYRELLDE